MMLTIDPGMNTGFAIWELGQLKEYGQWLTKHSSLEEDMRFCAQSFRNLLTKVRPGTGVFIEYPGVWGNSQTSMASVMSGDLIKLATIVGIYIGLSHPLQVKLITPQQWKGQLGKEAVKMRVDRALGLEIRSSHINDAIGIGLHILNRFQIRNQTRPFT